MRVLNRILLSLAISLVGTSYAIANNINHSIDELKAITLPDNWQPSKNPEALRSIWLQQSRNVIDGDFVKRKLNECLPLLENPSSINYTSQQTLYNFGGCYRNLFAMGVYSDNGRKLTLNTLHKLSINPEHTLVEKAKWSGKVNPDQWYQNYSYISEYAEWYSLNRQYLTIDKATQVQIEGYLTNYLLNLDFSLPLKFEPSKSYNGCSSKDDLSWIHRMRNTVKRGINQCGSVRFKAAIGTLSLALLLNDEDLFDQAIEHIDWVTSVHDEEGIFLPYTPIIKESAAFGYYHQQGMFLSKLTELFSTINYDFLKFKMRHGKTVAEALEMTYRINEDFKILGKYPGTSNNYAYPNSSWNYVKNMSHDEFVEHAYFNNHDGHWAKDQITGRLLFATDNPRFTSIYKTDLFKSASQFTKFSWSDFTPIPPSVLFESNQQNLSAKANQMISKANDLERIERLEQNRVKANELAKENRIKALKNLKATQELEKLAFEKNLQPWNLRVDNEKLILKKPEDFVLGEFDYSQSPTNQNRYEVYVDQLRDIESRNLIKGKVIYERMPFDTDIIEISVVRLLRKSPSVKSIWKELSSTCNISNLTLRISNNLTSSNSKQLQCIITNSENDDLIAFAQAGLYLLGEIENEL